MVWQARKAALRASASVFARSSSSSQKERFANTGAPLRIDAGSGGAFPSPTAENAIAQRCSTRVGSRSRKFPSQDLMSFEALSWSNGTVVIGMTDSPFCGGFLLCFEGLTPFGGERGGHGGHAGLASGVSLTRCHFFASHENHERSSFHPRHLVT